MHAHKPLTGIRVVELATAATGPVAATLMAEQGAQAVKVEPPMIGDTVRHLGTSKEGVSSFFASCNRGKQSLAVDLKQPEGVEIVRRLAEQADVLITNYRNGVLDRLGLGSDTLREANPRLVYVAINGFGIDGPLADAPAYDHILQGFSGISDMQGAEQSLDLVKTVLVDSITAYMACQAATAALFQRHTSGQGQHIDLSMLDSSLYFLWPGGMMNHTFVDEDVPLRPTLKATYRTFPTSDGFVVLAALTDGHWQGLLRGVQREDLLEDERYNNMFGRAAHLADLYELLDSTFAKMTNEEVELLLREADVPGSACKTVEEMMQHPQVEAVGAVQTQTHPLLGELRSAAHPARFGSRRMPPLPPVGQIGEATREVLQDLGYPPEAVDDLINRGVAAAPG